MNVFESWDIDARWSSSEIIFVIQSLNFTFDAKTLVVVHQMAANNIVIVAHALWKPVAGGA